MTPRPGSLSIWQIRIRKFFAPQEHETAVAGIANHLTKFWEPSMRKKIVRHLSEAARGSIRSSGKPWKCSGPNSPTKPDISVSGHPRPRSQGDSDKSTTCHLPARVFCLAFLLLNSTPEGCLRRCRYRQGRNRAADQGVVRRRSHYLQQLSMTAMPSRRASTRRRQWRNL
jgi:formate dehydrogenase subunit delta